MSSVHINTLKHDYYDLSTGVQKGGTNRNFAANSPEILSYTEVESAELQVASAS